MAKIKTFARLKPSEELYDDYECTKNRLYLRIPESYNHQHTLYNRTRAAITNHEFKYNQVFGINSTQQEVFNSAAKSIIDGFLEGYNGTIFAYGQTGSGKTFTMEGDLSNYDERGLSPRSLSVIFEAIAARQANGENITVNVSFLEIYQEIGYDLLKTVNKNGPGPTSFARVTVVDGPHGNAVIKNLSMHPVNTEEAAQALLTQGELNRKVAETSMNQRSSRSHAVFSVYLTTKKGDLVVKSKMHFVDLAGSERVCKTGVKGLQLSEAKYINLSLHYLEGVIIALHQDATSSRLQAQTAPAGMTKSWSSAAVLKRPYSAVDGGGRSKHIPYRNSLLTMVLKDSLGGNCLTAMIATVSLHPTNLSESISTCRFAQRVSCISNVARKNEEIDDKSMIKRLRTRVAELEVENNLLKHGDRSELEELDKPKLSKEDKDLCMIVVQDFLNGKVMDPVTAGVTDPFKFRECMRIFKKLIIDYNQKSVRLAEQLKQQPRHVQEAFYTGGKYHEAPLAKPSTRQEVTFRDDANSLARRAYTSHGNSRSITTAKPTVLRPRTQATERSAKTPEGQSRAQREITLLALQNKVAAMEKAREQVIRQGGNNQQYKSNSASLTGRTPYEKKKVKEVTQLNKKVENNFVQQINEAENLKAFRKSIIEQEYELLEETLCQKQQISQHQLADQHAYIIRLRKQTEDTDLLMQEKLVEKQLQKREDRICAKLNAVREKLNEIRSARDNGESSAVSARPIADKFATHKKSDGRLDTVKAMNTLQTQAKMQHKLQDKIDKQRVLVMDQQLAVKEMSTRQKLEEFKRKLALSRQGTEIQTEPAMESEPLHKSHSTHKSVETAKPTVDEIMRKYLGEKENTNLKAKVDIKPSAATVDEILEKYRRRREESQQTQSYSRPENMYRSVSAPRGSRTDLHKDESIHSTTGGKSSGSDNTNGYGRQKSNNERARQSKSSQPDKIPPETEIERRVHHQTHVVKAMEDGLRQYSISQKSASPMKKEQVDMNAAYLARYKKNKVARDVKERDFDRTLKSMLEMKNGHKEKQKTWQGFTTGFTNHTAGDQDLLKTKLQQFLNKQYRRKQKNGRNQPEVILGKSSSASSSRGSTNKFDQQLSGRRHAETATPKSQNSHRYAYESGKKTSAKTHASKQTSDISQQRYKAKSREGEMRSKSDVSVSSSNVVQPNQPATEGYVVKSMRSFSHLKNMNIKNEHVNRVRQTQQSACIIQRAWRKYKQRSQSHRHKLK